ncbi:MAG: hypothetical protein ACTHMY_27775 [Solirubrobacteraceae bacterium]
MRWRSGLLTGVVVWAGLMVAPAMASAATISESFSPSSIPLTGVSTLTFTITSPDAPSPHVVSFNDAVPAGLQVVGTPTTTCAAGALLPTGSSDIDFTDAARCGPSASR